ncbi:LOW QUALITY PROTEIN: PRAME family member 12 [Camelus ferus]|uniref:LOW QUALITY PROTEIN: PRAME family member 12 n=1 Tax=Camelus ferus TaxID=419612 RepID=S9WCB1_CAMFR|nr:LOW QUALITY PROTEIN: PRAME family member 12 [Camelus ferus]EPY74028.1 preferentially expressed antigen in melanoma-like protein [Camelus ferus]
MRVQSPPRLWNLAAVSLLRDNEASAIAALEYLPAELFPPLFLEAFNGRHSETLKALVQAWPFVRLPLGGLMHMPQEETFQAVLDGLDVLLAQKAPPRRCKLQVLDLRNTGQDFWNTWSGARAPDASSSSSMAPVAEDSSRTEQPLPALKVFIGLSLDERKLDEFLSYLMGWVEKREGSIHLCCKMLSILSEPIMNVMDVLRKVQLGCIQELHVDCNWTLPTLASFAPLLGQMSNVRIFFLSRVHVYIPTRQEQQYVVQFTSQFLRLHHLRDLYMESPSFLEGRLDQMLRCLKNPLDNLSITSCQLTESDLAHLSQCPSIRQLKGLDLHGVTLTNFSPELLQVLLEKVAATLQELDLDQCRIMDSHLEAILPALSRCSQLKSLSLCGNFFSMATMEKLLRHTAGLPSLSQELYPAPQESYSPQGTFHPTRLASLGADLFEILRGLGRPRTIQLSSSSCPHCSNRTFYHTESVIYP